MNTRRQFLATAPLGLAGAMAARTGSNATGEPVSQAGAATQSPASGSPPPLKAIPADATVLNWIPKHEDLRYTFGGVPAKHRIKPGTRIVSWTDRICFDGMVKTTKDLASKVVPLGHDKPADGALLHRRGRVGRYGGSAPDQGATGAHYAISSDFPGSGALVRTDRTAMLLADLPETTWRYEVDKARNVARTRSRDGRHSWEVPLAPFLGCLGVAPAINEARSTIVPGPFGGNMDCWEVRPGNTVFLGVNMPGALLSFGDGHYAQGEGATTGVAVEGAMNVELDASSCSRRRRRRCRGSRTRNAR